MSHPKLKDLEERQFAKPEKKYPLFSFKYTMQAHNRFNFDYFGKDIRKREEAYGGLMEKLKAISATDINALLFRQKTIGLETIPLTQFCEAIRNVAQSDELKKQITKATKLTVFRFKAQKNEYRVICKQDSSNQQIFYIIGFDFDFSAYDHGQ